MRRILVAVCLLAHSAYGSPQRGVQLGGGPRPVTYASPQPPTQPNYGPSFSQQLTFGPSDAGVSRPPGSPVQYRSPAPILLQQGSPTAAPPSFAHFQSASPFPSRGSAPVRATPAPPSDDEYEEYEDEEEVPKPQVHVTARPVQRAPVRAQPVSFSQGPQRLAVPQQPQAQAPVRQRQPAPQRQPIAAQPVQQYSPQPAPQRQSVAPQASRGQQVASYGLDGKRTRLTTPPPVQTLNRYMKQNEDGSITWGYENEDGTFKEETLGADCVVRGKYGYVDPDGQKREYEYQSGNPCDPNKKDQEEEEEEERREGPGPQQQVQGVINARPRPAQRRPVPQQPQYQPQYA